MALTTSWNGTTSVFKRVSRDLCASTTSGGKSTVEPSKRWFQLGSHSGFQTSGFANYGSSRRSQIEHCQTESVVGQQHVM